MRVIGSITARFGEDNKLVNPDYVDGIIVELTKGETRILYCLQEVWSNNFRYETVGTPEDMKMDDIFKAIKTFVEIKFSLNEFKEAVNRLDNILKEK